MRPVSRSHPSRRARPARAASLAAAWLVPALLAACGAGAPPASDSGAIRVAADAPLPATGAEPLADSGAAGQGAAGSATGTGAPTAPAPSGAWPRSKVSVAPRPSLPDAAARAGAGGARLTGRAAGERESRELPLLHARFDAQVSGDVARVEVTQYYRNPTANRLEAAYAFPLPPNAAVTEMSFRIGRRVVRSEVRRREEARKVYEAARAEGRTAALTEQERPNLFTQSVANVPPGETIAVTLRYVHEVPLDGGRYLFHVPTAIGPRYVPGAPLGTASGTGRLADTDRVPDASRITPPVVPEGARGADVDVVVRLVPAAAFEDVAARSHRIETGVDAAGARVVALAEDDRVANRDVVLSWRPAGAVPAAHALVQRERGEDFLLLFLQPPAEVAPALVRPKELVFLVDKSGSMSGAPLDRVKALVGRALDASGPDDTFRIVAFDGAAQSMSAGAVPVTPASVAAAKGWLGRLEAGGGTEMLTGIRAALHAEADPRRLRIVVFCTDGFIGNEAEIIEAVGALRGSARVFGFGIGSSVNRYLVEGVGRAGRGASEVVDLREPLDAAVERLFRRLDRPVLTDLELAFEGGGDVTDLLPARLPDLFAGQPLAVAGRVRGAAPRAVVLRGRLGSAPWSARLAVAAAPGGGDDRPVAGTLWARRRVDALLSATPSAPPPDAVEAVVATALRFSLVTPYTSFVAVERELLVDPALPLATVAVAGELPEGVLREAVLGPETSIQVLPARVKPGDPELRVAAPPDAVAVTVALPFEAAPRDAVRDPDRGDWVLRFLVPPAWPDGSFDAHVTVVRADGRREARRASIRVDTTAAPLAVVSRPASARPGETVRLALKPALPLGSIPGLAGRPGGLAAAVKGAMEVKEVLVRAPWGEVVRARLEGPLGLYVATLTVPAGAASGPASLEVVASDAAGNVSRRRLALAIGGGAAAPPGTAAASLAGTAALALALAAAAAGLAAAIGLVLRRRAGPPPLGLVLLGGALERASRAGRARRVER